MQPVWIDIRLDVDGCALGLAFVAPCVAVSLSSCLSSSFFLVAVSFANAVGIGTPRNAAGG